MIDATGFGERIKRAVLAYASQIGRRYSLAQFARDVGMLERGEEWSSSAMGEWISERSEPSLTTFFAMGAVLGVEPSLLAFGDAAHQQAVIERAKRGKTRTAPRTLQQQGEATPRKQRGA